MRSKAPSDPQSSSAASIAVWRRGSSCTMTTRSALILQNKGVFISFVLLFDDYYSLSEWNWTKIILLRKNNFIARWWRAPPLFCVFLLVLFDTYYSLLESCSLCTILWIMWWWRAPPLFCYSVFIYLHSVFIHPYSFLVFYVYILSLLCIHS